MMNKARFAAVALISILLYGCYISHLIFHAHYKCKFIVDILHDMMEGTVSQIFF